MKRHHWVFHTSCVVRCCIFNAMMLRFVLIILEAQVEAIIAKHACSILEVIMVRLSTLLLLLAYEHVTT